MPAISAKAPAKIILFGEHAVVYGKPAIAVPLRKLEAKAIIKPAPGAKDNTVRIKSPLIDLETNLDDLPREHPIAAIIQATLDYLEIESMPACTIRISSTIPVAAGLGSGAAVSVALARALGAFLGRPLNDAEISRLAYKIETIHHGTPSGIDNSVVAFNKPVYFVRDADLEFLTLSSGFHMLVADTGIPSPTVETVGGVRRRWQADPKVYNSHFEDISNITHQARVAMEMGDEETLGRLMNDNQGVLEAMGVSSPELETLIETARSTGALGAKLSGGGGGGNMIALVSPEHSGPVKIALESAGSPRVIVTIVN